MEFILSVISLCDLLFDMSDNWTTAYFHNDIHHPMFIHLRLFFMLRDLRILLII